MSRNTSEEVDESEVDFRRMQSLRKIAMMSVVKYGTQGRESLPEVLKRELDSTEARIKANMTGWDYREDVVRPHWEFDIHWELGYWGLYLRLLTSTGWEEVRADIEPGTTSILDPEWSLLFGLKMSHLKEIAITDYNIQLMERKVRFVGYFVPQEQGEKPVLTREFCTEFHFSQGGSYLTIISQSKRTSRTKSFVECG